VSLWVQRSKFAARRTVYALPFPKEQFSRELIGTAKVIAFDAVYVWLFSKLDWFQRVPPTFWNVALSVLGLFLWVEFVYYWLHRLMHRKSFYFVHRAHHESLVVRPLTSLTFSISERMLQSLIAGTAALAFSQVVPLPVEGPVLYYFVFFLLDILGHLNVEVFPAGFGGSILGKVVYTPTFHAMHHARFKGHYGLFTSIMDHLFGTVFDDYARVQADAASGKPMTSLAERRRD